MDGPNYEGVNYFPIGDGQHYENSQRYERDDRDENDYEGDRQYEDDYQHEDWQNRQDWVDFTHEPPRYGDVSDNDSAYPPVTHPVPTPAPTASSSLLHALATEPPTPPPRPPRRVRTSPPPGYNPYPYPQQWYLWGKLDPGELRFYHRRDDYWLHDIDGYKIKHVCDRVFCLATTRIEQMQRATRQREEDARLARPPAPEPLAPAEAAGVRVDLAEVDGTPGLPARLMVSTRRALERGMLDPKAQCFANWPRDTLWVRVKWAAYPQHEPVRPITVTIRRGKKHPRRPATRLEVALELAGILSQFYSDVSELEPAPECAHLALGPGEGRISLYALRMMGIRATPDGVFDMLLKTQNTGGEQCGTPTATSIPAEETRDPTGSPSEANSTGFVQPDPTPSSPQGLEQGD
ncbi:hypothetical protein BD413DRAFT_608572 [Trametes elegans]|nr:hypothetical protein BD413DRAFT_608572 [Trametes elegans]